MLCPWTEVTVYVFQSVTFSLTVEDVTTYLGQIQRQTDPLYTPFQPLINPFTNPVPITHYQPLMYPLPTHFQSFTYPLLTFYTIFIFLKFHVIIST